MITVKATINKKDLMEGDFNDVKLEKIKSHEEYNHNNFWNGLADLMVVIFNNFNRGGN